MVAVEKWMEGKPQEIAALAPLASFAPVVSEALTEFRNQAVSLTPQPALPQWLPLYRQHRKIILHLQTYLFNESVLPSLAPLVFDDNAEVEHDLVALVREGYDQPEMLFFFKVWGPCWLLYGTSPTNLFRQARLGKVSAFEKLLRLDNSVLFDPKLSELFHNLKAKKSKRNYEQLLLAFGRPATGRISP